MGKVWDYNGYTIDEGLKPRDENYKADYYQYFFIVKKDDRRLMKFCVWAPRADLAGLDQAKAYAAGGGRLDEWLRDQGVARVKQLIDAGAFKNTLLEITAAGTRELPLDELPDKLA